MSGRSLSSLKATLSLRKAGRKKGGRSESPMRAHSFRPSPLAAPQPWPLFDDSPHPYSLYAFVLARLLQHHSSSPGRASTITAKLSTGSGLNLPEEPITLFRLELERLQYILHFPEEVGFQLSAAEYKLFYSAQPLDFVRYVSADLTTAGAVSNVTSDLHRLVKRFSEISSWVTHLIVSQPTHDERKSVLGSILRVVRTSVNIGNFNAAVELLTGLRSEKLRPFWLSLPEEEKREFGWLCEALLPAANATPSAFMATAVARGLAMPQAKLIPFFGTFLRDLYAIVDDVPSLFLSAQEGSKDSLEFLSDFNGEDHFTSRVSVGGLLNLEKIQLIGLVLENMESFHRHFRTERVLAGSNAEEGGEEAKKTMSSKDSKGNLNLFSARSASVQETKLTGGGYEPIQPIAGLTHEVSLVRMEPGTVDLDLMQRLHHGTTVIHFDMETGRSALAHLRLDPSGSILLWRRFTGGRTWGSVRGDESLNSANNDSKQHSSKRDADNRSGKGSGGSSNPPGSATLTPSHSPANAGGLDSRSAGLESRAGRMTPSAAAPRLALHGPPELADICSSGVEEGFLLLPYVKSVERVDSWDLDIEAIYRRHSLEEMSLPVLAFSLNYGPFLADNELTFFLAPIETASAWLLGLEQLLSQMRLQHAAADRRMLWLKKLYIDLWSDSLAPSTLAQLNDVWATPRPSALPGPRPLDALTAFGGKVDQRWRDTLHRSHNLPHHHPALHHHQNTHGSLGNPSSSTCSQPCSRAAEVAGEVRRHECWDGAK